MQCNVQVGFFLLRPCNEPASQTCSRCKKYACPAHLREIRSEAGPKFLCLTCARPNDVDTDNSQYYDNHSHSTSSSTANTPFNPGGGEFAGGGASGDWNAAAPMNQESTTESPDMAANVSNLSALSAQEIAAFDEITDFDKESGRSELYDS